MITRTYLDKFSTIIKDSSLNTGTNPISELVYGKNLTRALIHFDCSKVKEMFDNGTFYDINKLHHYLKITNAGSLDFTQLFCGEISNISDDVKLRASSFDLIFFLIPQEWDNGKGFDYNLNFFNQGYFGKGCHGNFQDSSKLTSFDGSNWYQARNGYFWEEEGIYSNETLMNEYDNFLSESGSTVIIGRQHFDIGNENINLDITETFNNFMLNYIENYGIGIAYAPNLEATEDKIEHYLGLLTHKTNTFFEPYVETVYDGYICDDRSNFALDKNNKLYLYCNIGDSLENLDEVPTCEVNGTQYEVKQAAKGVYYIDINLSRKEYKPNTMLYDTWSNIKYNGVEMDDVELDFVTKSQNIFFNVSDSIQESVKFTPIIYGIQYDERIKRGDIRKVVFANKINYEANRQAIVDDMEWRLYIKDGTREVEVFKWENVNKSFLENYVLIDTSILIPQKYYIDVKYKYNMEMIKHHNVLSFEITDDLNNKYA